MTRGEWACGSRGLSVLGFVGPMFWVVTAVAQSPSRPVLIEAPPLVAIPPRQVAQIPVPPIRDERSLPRTAWFAPSVGDAATVVPTLPPTYAPNPLSSGVSPAATWLPASLGAPVGSSIPVGTGVCGCCGAVRGSVTSYVPSIGQQVPAGTAGFSPIPITAWRPVGPVSSPTSRYYVGRGVLGQPKLFVNGQPVRNALRALAP